MCVLSDCRGLESVMQKQEADIGSGGSCGKYVSE